MSGDAIIFVNVVIKLIKCYAEQHEEDPDKLIDAINIGYKGEKNGEKD